ncbi:hypothetical protein C1H46_007976 [Malus baccata]|uniref:Uncharacterized protein n=1 Tax=Malus baccata TaxID=106549 RepID=A0A540N5Y6_MALBA|nr:hypothetical protein C1H46_007976 [Malus baccata]
MDKKRVQETRKQREREELDIDTSFEYSLPEAIGLIAFAGMTVIIQQTAESSSPERNAISELERNQFPELPRRPQPQAYRPLDFAKRPFYLLRQALLPAELVASEKKLPLLHQRVVAASLLHVAVVEGPTASTPSH